MSKSRDNRAGNQNGADDRRGSCRYSVDEVPAVLGWWDIGQQIGDDQGATRTVADPEPAAPASPRPRAFDASTYSAIMARVPALRGTARSYVVPRTARQSALSNVLAAHSPLNKAHSTQLAIAPAKTAPAVERERETPETRAVAASSSSEPIMQTCRARIIDISQTGMSLLGEAIPREGQPVWVRLEDSTVTDWVEGTLRGIAQQEPGLFLVRLSFREGCPYDFFKVAVYGGTGK